MQFKFSVAHLLSLITVVVGRATNLRSSLAEQDCLSSICSWIPNAIPHLFPRAWMYGPLSTVDPDVVENDVGAIWRELYKLEKHFGEEANPLGMAKKVHSYILTHACTYMQCA